MEKHLTTKLPKSVLNKTYKIDFYKFWWKGIIMLARFR